MIGLGLVLVGIILMDEVGRYFLRVVLVPVFVVFLLSRFFFSLRN